MIKEVNENDELIKLRENGNSFFKKGEFQSARAIYSEIIASTASNSDLKVTALCNRAACALKIGDFLACKDDCTVALSLSPKLPKAYFRRAQALEALGDIKEAFKDTSKLLHMEPKNNDAIQLMKRIKIALELERQNDSEINRILTSLRANEHVQDGLKALISLCADDKAHAIDLIRKNGVVWIGEYLDSYRTDIYGTIPDHRSSSSSSSNTTTPTVLQDHLFESQSLAIRVLAAAANHEHFVRTVLKILHNSDGDCNNTNNSNNTTITNQNGNTIELSTTTSTDVIHITPIVQGGDIIWEESAAKTLITNLILNMKTQSKSTSSSPSSHISSENTLLAMETLTLFMSETADYTGHDNKVIDTRSESMEDRKVRMRIFRLCKRRSKLHARWTMESGAYEVIFPLLDAESANDRQKAGVCLANIVNAMDDDESLKTIVLPFLVIAGDEADADTTRMMMESGHGLTYSASFRPPPMDKCRLRAAIEAALFLSRPELAAWALAQPGGVAQLLLLVSSMDARCQEIAAEVLCLSASSESGAPLLAPAVSSGALHSLLQSPVSNTRAAAASALTKLSLKAKALSEDSPEISQTMNVVLDVIRQAAATTTSTSISNDSSVTAGGTVVNTSKSELVKFSAIDLDKKYSSDKNDDNGSYTLALTSTERAIEVLAAMVGKTHIKEELVHGSYRVAAAVAPLIALTKTSDLSRGSASYGLAHMFASLTVTNHELRAIALAEKDMTPDQFQKLQELHRIKTKDKDGNDIGDAVEPDDPDSDNLCKLRIRCIVALDVIPALVKLMGGVSKKTKSEAVRALRQICVEQSVRGMMVQQGGLKACCTLADDDTCETAVRREAAHAIAKTLVTTNPSSLSEHLRDVEGSFLQQFESCLALTNLTSFGQVDQDRLVAEKGVNSVHFLMFSDHFAVRRAATEVLCNMATHESVLKASITRNTAALLRVGERIRLWVSLSDDWDNEDNEEAVATARASLATLAMAAGDEAVTDALISENIAKVITRLLSSEMMEEELLHRALVLTNTMVETKTAAGLHLMEGGIVPLLGELVDTDINEMLKNIVRNIAICLSKINPK
eukprot:gene7218-14717_t